MDLEHDVEVLEDSFALETFSPVNPDYHFDKKKV